MDALVAGHRNLQQARLDQLATEFLSQLTSRELMDALMAADMPMGGTNEQRVERLLSAVQPQDIVQFLPQAARQRLSQPVTFSIG